MHQYLKLENGKLTLPRQFASKEKDAISLWGAGNYIHFDLEEGFDPYCYDDTPVNGSLVKNQARITEVTNAKQAAEDEQKRILKKVVAKKLISAAKPDDQLSELERKMKYGIGTEPTLSEVEAYIAANSTP
jgi:hypothetical protein